MADDMGGSEHAPTTVPTRSANESAHAIFRNVGVNYINLLRATALGLLVTPVLVNTLGTVEFGVWSLALGVSAYVAMIGAGLSSALVAKVATAEAQHDRAEMSTILRTARTILIIASSIGMAAVVCLAAVFDVLFKVPHDLGNTARLTVLLTGAAAMIAIATTSWTAALVGIGRVDATSLVGLGSTTALAVGQMIAALLGADLSVLGAIALVVSLITLWANQRLVRRIVHPLPRGRTSRRAARSLLSLAGRDAMVVVASKLAFSTDVLLVGAVAGPVPASAYAVASRAASFARDIANSAGDVLLPSFSNAVARNDTTRVRRLYEASVMLGLMIAMPLAIIFATVGRQLLAFWLHNVPEHAEQALVALAILIVLQVPGRAVSLLLMGAQRSNLLMRFTWPMALLNVSLSLLATLWLGVAGPAIGSIVAVAVTDPLLLRRAAPEFIRVRASLLYRDLLLTVGPPALLTAAAAVAVTLTIHVGAVLSLAVAIALGIIFACASLVWLRVTSRGAYLAVPLRQIPIAGSRLAKFLAGPKEL